MKTLLFLAATAVMLAPLPDLALAQATVVPVTNTQVDLAPVLNPIMQVLGVIIMGLVIPLVWAFVGKTLKSWGIEATAEMAATRAVVDGIAQKAIGGAITRLQVKPGQITIDAKNDIVAEAANQLVQNAGDSLGKLGVKDNDKILKAREIIESRLGLMDAAAAGVPVPNPSHPPAPVVAPVVAGVPVEGAFRK